MKLLNKFFAGIAAMGVILAALVVATVLSEDCAYKVRKVYIRFIGKVNCMYNDDVEAVFVGGVLTREQVEQAEKKYGIYGIEKEKKEIIDELVVNELLMIKAQAHGIRVEDEEVLEEIRNAIGSIKKDPEALKQFNEYLSAAGITEEEYMEMAEPVYKRLLMTGLYKKQVLEPEFLEHIMEEPGERQETFEEYYKRYKEKLLDNAHIWYCR